MKTMEFYEKNEKVFTEEVLQKYSFIDDVKAETEMLNFFFLDKFAECEITTENTLQASRSADFVLYKMQEYLQSVYDAIATQFNPLLTSDITDVIEKTGENKDVTEYDSTFKTHTEQKTIPGSTTTTAERTFDNNTLTDTAQVKNGGEDNSEGDNNTTREGQDTTTHTMNTKDIHKKTGFDGIDYEKAIRSIYESKQVNLYEIILTEVFDVICVPIYHFD